MVILLSIGQLKQISFMPSNAATSPQLTRKFTCAVAVGEKIGDLCVHSKPGSVIQVSVEYCADGQAKSNDLTVMIG